MGVNVDRGYCQFKTDVVGAFQTRWKDLSVKGGYIM
jgi:hypothetical protein